MQGINTEKCAQPDFFGQRGIVEKGFFTLAFFNQSSPGRNDVYSIFLVA